MFSVNDKRNLKMYSGQGGGGHQNINIHSNFNLTFCIWQKIMTVLLNSINDVICKKSELTFCSTIIS